MSRTFFDEILQTWCLDNSQQKMITPSYQLYTGWHMKAVEH